MSTLLVLGSKPEPNLPPASAFDQVACANASGASAKRYGLPTPSYTVISGVLTSGKKASNRLALEALRGLQTKRLYFYPRPLRGRTALGRGITYLRTFKMRARHFRGTLRSLPYRYEEFVDPGLAYYHGLVRQLCDGDASISKLIEQKQPSTGIMAIVLGIAEENHRRIIVSGFSFEITHAYARNPQIDELGTARSKHAGTDVALLSFLARKFGNIYTTEPVVSERAGVPLLSDQASWSAAALS